MGDERQKFLDAYVNLPMPLRKDIIAVVDGEPISWLIAYKEIKAETELGEKVLKELVELKLWDWGRLWFQKMQKKLF